MNDTTPPNDPLPRIARTPQPGPPPEQFQYPPEYGQQPPGWPPQYQQPYYGPVEVATPRAPVDWAVRIQAWFWPIFCWMMFGFNFVIMLLVVRDMMGAKYDPLAHACSMSFATGVFIVLACVHRWLLTPRPAPVYELSAPSTDVVRS